MKKSKPILRALFFFYVWECAELKLLRWRGFHHSVQTDIWTGPCLSPHWAEVLTRLFGQDTQLCRPCNITTRHASWTSPPTWYHGNRRQQCSNINTLTLFRCLEPRHMRNAGRSGCGGQCNFTLPGGRAAGGKIGGKCVSVCAVCNKIHSW